MNLRIFWAAALMSVLFPVPSFAGKLDDVRRATGHGSDSESGDDDDNSDEDEGCGWLEILLNSCTDDDEDETPPPRTSPRSSAGDPRGGVSRAERDKLTNERYYLQYPYAAGYAGNLVHYAFPGTVMAVPEQYEVFAPRDATACVDDRCYRWEGAAPTGTGFQTGRVQFALDAGRDLDGLTRMTIGGALLSANFIGVETKWTLWIEPTPGDPDALWIGDGNLVFSVLSRPWLQLWLGAGARGLIDAADGTAGFNATGIAELYPVRPLVVRTTFDAGNLGKAIVTEAEGTLGFVFHHVEVFGGAQHLQINNVRFRSVFAGLRLHF